MSKTPIDMFIEEYNYMVNILDVLYQGGVEGYIIMENVIIEWSYGTLERLDRDGHVNFIQFNSDGIELEEIIFVDNYTGKSYNIQRLGIDRFETGEEQIEH